MPGIPVASAGATAAASRGAAGATAGKAAGGTAARGASKKPGFADGIFDNPSATGNLGGGPNINDLRKIDPKKLKEWSDNPANKAKIAGAVLAPEVFAAPVIEEGLSASKKDPKPQKVYSGGKVYDGYKYGADPPPSRTTPNPAYTRGSQPQQTRVLYNSAQSRQRNSEFSRGNTQNPQQARPPSQPAPTVPPNPPAQNNQEPSEREQLELESLRRRDKAERKAEEERQKQETKAAEEDRKRGSREKREKVKGIVIGQSGVNFFIFSALAIWIIDAFWGYIGVAQFMFKPRDIYNMSAWSAFIIIMIYHIFKNRDSLDVGEWISYGIAILTLIFVAFTGTLNWIGLIHLAFIIAIWWKIVKDHEDKITSNIMLSFLIIADFYRYVILKSFVPMTAVVIIMAVPFLLIYTIMYCWEKFPERRLTKYAFLALVTVMILLNWESISIASTAIVQGEEGVNVANPWNVITGVWHGFWGGFVSDIIKAGERQLDYATGGYYTGMVEENEDPENQLGVYLENVEAADNTFFETEAVSVWGDLKARTLDQPIYVHMSCESGDRKGTIMQTQLANPEGYKIDKLEQTGFECRFRQNQLKVGSNTIKIKADFTFQTYAYIKTYFMDIERIRALRREDKDPLAQYGITDKKPTGVFTNGPVKLGMGTIDPPVGLGTGINPYDYIGITVEKQWPGSIKNITNVTIQIPKVLKLEADGNEEVFCKGEFEKVGEDDGGYVTYRMKDDVVKKIKTPITGFKSWRCSIVAEDISKVLGTTPVTTYYYRANVKYIYETEKTISVFIKSVPKEQTKITDCDVNCTDSAGCICDAEGCNMPKGGSLGYEYTCNNYFGGCDNAGRTIEDDIRYISLLRTDAEKIIAFNTLCSNKNKDTLTANIKESKALTDKKKDELINAANQSCVDPTTYGFAIIAEDIIIKRADCIMKIFKTIKDIKDWTDPDKKQQVITKKNETINLFDNILAHFRENLVWASGSNNAHITTMQTKKSDLESINFG